MRGSDGVEGGVGVNLWCTINLCTQWLSILKRNYTDSSFSQKEAPDRWLTNVENKVALLRYPTFQRKPCMTGLVSLIYPSLRNFGPQIQIQEGQSFYVIY